MPCFTGLAHVFPLRAIAILHGTIFYAVISDCEYVLTHAEMKKTTIKSILPYLNAPVFCR